jgi:mechanosensitive ion channel-like protein
MIVMSIPASIDNGFSVFLGWLPRVVGFLLVLLIGYIVAKVVGNLVARLSNRARLDRTVHLVSSRI